MFDPLRRILARREFLRAGIGATAGITGLAIAGQVAAQTGDASPTYDAMAQHGSTMGTMTDTMTDAMMGSNHGNAMLMGAVDHQRNGFDPMQMLVEWDYGVVTTLPSGQRQREYTIYASDKEIEIAPGLFFPAWTYNGRVPGPALRATEGDHLKINFINASTHPHTIHFHGVHTAEMDGVTGVGVGEIPPGGSFTYEFEAEPFGCHLYHCHATPLRRHIHKGLYGAFIVDPKEGRPLAREFMMVMNAFDTNFDSENEIYAVNTVGHEYARRPIPIQTGELVRLYLINITEFDPINSLHIHAEFFNYYDHGTTLEPTHRIIDTIMQCQAQRGIVEFRYRWPGRYMFHAHQSEFAELGWMGFFDAVNAADWDGALARAQVESSWSALGTSASTVDFASKEVVR